jgi:hypothetical protein
MVALLAWGHARAQLSSLGRECRQGECRDQAAQAPSLGAAADRSVTLGFGSWLGSADAESRSKQSDEEGAGR